MVIAIGRQYGSGGRDIGKSLAVRLGFEYYDNELLTIAAKNKGFDVETISQFDEVPASSFIYNAYIGGISEEMLPLNQKLAFAQFQVIKQMADKGPCVIIGRCADYVLREREDCTSIFIHAPIEFRKKRLLEYGVDELSAEKTAHKVDKKRASYYSFYTHNKWGDVSSYNLSIDSGLMGIKATTDALYEFMCIRQRQFGL